MTAPEDALVGEEPVPIALLDDEPGSPPEDDGAAARAGRPSPWPYLDRPRTRTTPEGRGSGSRPSASTDTGRR